MPRVKKGGVVLQLALSAVLNSIFEESEESDGRVYFSVILNPAIENLRSVFRSLNKLIYWIIG
jgi:hypothetical protein